MSEHDRMVNLGVGGELPTMPSLRLDPRQNPGLLAPVFARLGRIHIPALLERESALAVHRSLTAGGVPWQTHFNDASRIYDIPSDQFDALSPADRAALLHALHERARHHFQYFFENFSMADHWAKGDFMELDVMRVFEFLRSEAMLDFVRRLTGIREIATVDAQATRYRPGSFLTTHDDRDEDKGRVAAYVLNMTPRWSVDWGGILNFLDEDGHVAEGYRPVFNAINLFRVPTPHSVSLVAPYAGEARLSITGWFRRF